MFGVEMGKKKRALSRQKFEPAATHSRERHERSQDWRFDTSNFYRPDYSSQAHYHYLSLLRTATTIYDLYIGIKEQTLTRERSL